VQAAPSTFNTALPVAKGQNLWREQLVLRDRDELGSGTDADSGGTQWLLAPGLQYFSRSWIVEGTVQLPVAADPNGDAIEDDYIVRIGFRRNI
jgi:hypothetical protein